MPSDGSASNGSPNGVESKTPIKMAESSEFIQVTDPTGELLEIPTNSDNTLNMTTLQAAISGATGLKYKNPKTNANRTVGADATGTKLLPPPDGWDDKIFNVIMNSSLVVSPPPAPAVQRGADVSVKRRKMDDSEDDEDSENEGRLGRKRAAESSPLPERRPVDLLVLGVCYKTSDVTFKAYFETFGPVVFAEIKRSSEGVSKGFGFIQMTTIEDQEKVMKYKEHSLDGRKLEVKLPEQRSHWDSLNTPYGKKQPREAVNKIFVGRLVDKINEANLRDFFEKEAKKIDNNCTVTDVFVPSPFRGFGFVTFSSSDVADKICRPGNYVVENVSVVVRLAVPKDTYPLNSTPQYKNDYGYSYGYGRGGAGYTENRQDYQHAYESPRPYGGVWSPQPTSSVNTPVRGTMVNNRTLRPNRRSAASPAFSSSGIPPPTQPPQPLIPDPQSYNMVPNQIANGIDALNLNHRNPELVNAAWHAFFNTLNSNGHTLQNLPMVPMPPPHGMPTMSPHGHGMSPMAQGYIPHPPPPSHQGWQQ